MTVSTTASKIKGYLPDAPSDGSQYARKDGAWTVVSATGGTSDHGALTGLADDDHTQYLLADGSRAGASAGAQDFGSNGIKANTIAASSGDTIAISDTISVDDSLEWNSGKGVLDDTGVIYKTGDFDYWKVIPSTSIFASVVVKNSKWGLNVQSWSTLTDAQTIRAQGKYGDTIYAQSDNGKAITAHASSTASGTAAISVSGGEYAIKISGSPVDGGGQLYKNLANATADTDALNRITADGRYLQDAPSDGSQYARKDGAWSVVSATGGTSDHGALTGLSDDDHTQYHNDTRGDARYYTQSQMDTSLSGKSDTGHTHTESDITDLGNYEPAFTKNTGFNKALGTTSGTVSEGNHTHTESDITDLGNYEPAFTKNTGFNKALGTTSGTVSEGNHTHSNYLTDAPSNGSEYVRKDGAWAVASSGGGASDHGSLSGLGDDDHTQYLLATGARTGATSSDQVFTNSVKAGGYKTGTYAGIDVTFRAYLGTTATNFYVNKGIITGHS